MREKKLQVFVSSTFTDLKEERQAAVEAILSAGHIPAGMELFTAGDETQMTVIKRWIDDSDVYFLLLGGRYGSIEPRSGKSYTHLEYEYAVEQGKPLFSIVTNESALEKKLKRLGSHIIETDSGKELKAFRAVVVTKMVKFWDDIKDIKLAIYETLGEFRERKGLIGWVRSDTSLNNTLVVEEIARLTKENSELRERLQTHNTEPLYNGLSYENLEKLLKKTIYKSGETEENLFNMLLTSGQRFAQGAWLRTLPEMMEDLIKYNLVSVEKNIQGEKFCRLTEDGHNFYLKAIFLEQMT